MTIWQMGLSFLKLGAIGFGGGVAVVAMMEQECVQKHHCLETEEFLHGVGLGQILGPFAVNTAIFIGYRMFGFGGALLAEIAFLAPSIFLVILLSWLYFAFHQIPSLQGALVGLGPVVIALIINAAWSMGRKSVRTSAIATGLFIAAVIGSILRVNPLAILAIAGLIGFLFKLGHKQPKSSGKDSKKNSKSSAKNNLAIAPPIFLPLLQSNFAYQTLAIAPDVAAPVTASLITLATVFIKVGLAFFGGGFVLIPILSNLLVTDLHWLTHQQFIDGVAISQLTPGPIAVLATFTGYRVAGIVGGLVATVALFLPATILMLFISHYYQILRNVKQIKDFLAGINPAVVGLILSAAITLAPTALQWSHPFSIVLCVIALALLARWKWHPAFVLGIGALTGIIISSALA
jgi:chromate transporter